MKYFVGDKSFRTEKELQDFAKSILYDDKINTCLGSEDFYFMIDYFKKLHFRWDQKNGVGIKKIWRVIDPVYGKYRSFKIERTDSTTTDISYIISNIKEKKAETEFRQALRFIIEPQILEFKITKFGDSVELKCELTGVPIFFNECHADHFNPTFDKIVRDFVEIHQITDFSKYVAPSRDNQTITELADDFLAKSFYDFHKSVANLRLLSAKANLTLKRK